MLAKLRRYFISGLVVFLPTSLTIYLFVWTLHFLDGVFGNFIQPIILRKFGFYFGGLSVLIGFTFILLIGFLATNYFGRKIYVFFENQMIRLPFFRQVYPAIKEMAIFLFSRDRLSFKQVVILEYPRKGVYSYGFLTSEHASSRVREKIKEDLVNVFIPSSPSPVTGFVLMVPRKELVFVDISVEEAVKLNVSGGVVNPF